MENKEIIPPERKFEKLLDELMEATPEEYAFRGKTHKMGWLRNKTVRMMTHAMLHEENDHKRNMKLCAILRVNNVFAWFRHLVYAVKWRWYMYVLDLSDIEAFRVINAAKNTAPSEASLAITILATAMLDTSMATTRKEASAIQAAQGGGQPSR